MKKMDIPDCFTNDPLSFDSDKLAKPDHAIAVIGISCRAGRYESAEQFWNGVVRGMNGIRQFPQRRAKELEPYLSRTGVAWSDRQFYDGGFLEDVSLFDNSFFSISPRDAALMDPNQRLMLESAWLALADAGYTEDDIRGTNTGVFVGHSTDFGEQYRNIVKEMEPGYDTLSIAGNINSIIPGRISYLLDLKGPSMVVDTACSSSLAAVHTACRSLQTGECTVAIAGSVKLDFVPLMKYKQKEMDLGTISPDGITRTFDRKASGTGYGEGVFSLILKPLADAKADGNRIYAVIRGSAVNQDGNSVGLTAPNAAAQRDVILKAWKDAGISPESIDYIEVHGTATGLGDPIEISGIEQAFRRYTDRKQFCAVSAVKTNLGHLDHAAGMAGLIKAILSLKHGIIPPLLHFRSPNERIHFSQSPVYVNDQARIWQVNETPRRCGVSSFALCGTNCHLVLEEAPEIEVQPISGCMDPFVRKRLWVSPGKQTDIPVGFPKAETSLAPLIDRCAVASDGLAVYETILAVDSHWVLQEHIVGGSHMVMGTGYLEMVLSALNHCHPGQAARLSRVFFLVPLTLEKNQSCCVHTILHTAPGKTGFRIVSRIDGRTDFNLHCEGEYTLAGQELPERYDLSAAAARCQGQTLPEYSTGKNEIITSDRWNCVETLSAGDGGVFAEIKIKPRYEQELAGYLVHPAVLDETANLAQKSIGEGLYLPFAYPEITCYGKMPARFFCHLVRTSGYRGSETASFDFSLIHPDGTVFLQAKQYTIKKADGRLQGSPQQAGNFLQMGWRAANLKGRQTVNPETVILLEGTAPICNNITAALRERCSRVVRVTTGQGFARKSPSHYIIGNTPEDYRRLVTSLDWEQPCMVIHAMTLSAGQDGYNSLDQGLYSAFHLLKALSDNRVRPVLLNFLTQDAYSITGEEHGIIPEHAAMSGLIDTVRCEFRRMPCQLIDIDSSAGIQAICDALMHIGQDSVTAVRAASQYIRELREESLPEITEPQAKIRDNGVYLITGGTGGLGLALAGHLARSRRVNLVLLARKEVPPRNKWEQLLSKKSDTTWNRLIDTVREIESRGSSVLICRGDVSNQMQMKSVLNSVRQEFGRIDGMFHAAGTAGSGYLFQKKFETFCAVLSAKVTGTRVLDELTKDDPPDFLILFSSISSIFAEHGQSDYAAANSFLNAYAGYRNRTGRYTLSICWPAWTEIGMAVDYAVDLNGNPIRSLSPQQALESLDTLLGRKLDAVIPGQRNPDYVFPDGVVPIAGFDELTLPDITASLKPAVQTRVKEKDGETVYAVISRIWNDVLGLEDADPQKSFFDMGGDSVSSAYLWREIDANYPQLTDLSDLFTYSSIQAMSSFIEQKYSAGKQPEPAAAREEDLDSLLDRLAGGELTEQEIDAL